MLLRLLDRARVLSYDQAKIDVFLLAERLVKRYGDELRQFDFVAVPRGGTIVLGMLAYCLDLERVRTWSGDPDTPLVVVDDSCYSGTRIRAALNEHPDRKRVILAFLYSTEEVRAEIVKAEPSVAACVSARNLEDLLPSHIDDPESRQAHRSRWLERRSEPSYWAGFPELVVFPWSEPSNVIWNAETEQIENGWRLASPDLCLKNWADLKLPPRAVEPEFRIPDKVAYRLVDDTVFLFHPDHDDVFHLENTASLMWRALAAYGNRDVVLDHLAGVYQAAPETLRRDLDLFVTELLTAELLERVVS